MRQRLLYIAMPLLLMPIPESVAGQSVCGWVFEDGCNPLLGEHKVQGPAPDGYTDLHGECLVCISNWSDCHPGCMPDFHNEADTEAYSSALDDAQAGDIMRLFQLSASLSAYIMINSQRSSIQIIGCSGAVVANIPLASREFAWASAYRRLVPRSGVGSFRVF
jgi:hypothetical protein